MLAPLCLLGTLFRSSRLKPKHPFKNAWLLDKLSERISDKNKDSVYTSLTTPSRCFLICLDSNFWSFEEFLNIWRNCWKKCDFFFFLGKKKTCKTWTCSTLYRKVRSLKGWFFSFSLMGEFFKVLCRTLQHASPIIKCWKLQRTRFCPSTAER